MRATRRPTRAASDAARNTPCVVCGELPSVGTVYAEVQCRNGRSCQKHADQAIADGTMVALDDGGVKNFGRRRG